MKPINLEMLENELMKKIKTDKKNATNGIVILFVLSICMLAFGIKTIVLIIKYGPVELFPIGCAMAFLLVGIGIMIFVIQQTLSFKSVQTLKKKY